jgi:hypothetical protein
MKNIEKYIIENRDAFNSMEPEEGHFQRFEHKLKKRGGTARIVQLVAPVLKIAAIFVLVAMSSLWIIDNFFTESTSPQGVSLSEVSPELREVEIYYTSMINEKYSEIKSIDLNSDETQKDMLLKELDEMNSVYNSLKLELKNSPSNERIINAMIQYYQMKAEVMEQILGQLKELETSTTLKTTQNETTEI